MFAIRDDLPAAVKINVSTQHVKRSVIRLCYKTLDFSLYKFAEQILMKKTNIWFITSYQLIIINRTNFKMMMNRLWYLRTRETQQSRCGYLLRWLLFRCHQAPLRVIIPPEMLRSCWFVHIAFCLLKKSYPWNVQELLVSGPLWQTERANQNFILQVFKMASWCVRNLLDDNMIDIVEAKRARHKRPLFTLCWHSWLCFGHQATTLQNSLSGENRGSVTLISIVLNFRRREASLSWWSLPVCPQLRHWQTGPGWSLTSSLRCR